MSQNKGLREAWTLVWIKTSFAAVHRWPGAPQRSVLEYPHRHRFHVKAAVYVNHNERAVEFLDMQQQVEEFCREQFGYTITGQEVKRSMPASCETMAGVIAEYLLQQGYHPATITVAEDNENGATKVYYPPVLTAVAAEGL